MNLLLRNNVNEIVRGHDVVADALDNITARKLLEKACREENIPLVHGAICRLERTGFGYYAGR